MPLYEYTCKACGSFDAWRAIAERQQPMVCPTCTAPAQRVFSPPMLLSTGLSTVRKHSSEPRLVERSTDRAPVQPKATAKTRGRPWMVNH